MVFDNSFAEIVAGVVPAKSISCIGLANHTLVIGDTETRP